MEARNRQEYRRSRGRRTLSGPQAVRWQVWASQNPHGILQMTSELARTIAILWIFWKPNATFSRRPLPERTENLELDGVVIECAKQCVSLYAFRSAEPG